MKKLLSIAVLSSLCAVSTQAWADYQGFRCTTYDKDAIQLTVTASLSPAGTLSSDVSVRAADGTLEYYDGGTNFIGEDTVQLETRKTNSYFEFQYFGQLDPKNYSHFAIKLPNGAVKVYDSKDVDCMFY